MRAVREAIRRREPSASGGSTDGFTRARDQGRRDMEDLETEHSLHRERRERRMRRNWGL